jgi:hypothetical protein
MAEMALDCVQSVETWEGRSSSQHPTRTAYAKFETSSVNIPTIRPFSSAINLSQLVLTLQFAKYFQYVGNTSVASSTDCRISFILPSAGEDRLPFYRVSIKSFPDYEHLLQENYVEYKHTFFSKCNST